MIISKLQSSKLSSTSFNKTWKGRKSGKILKVVILSTIYLWTITHYIGFLHETVEMPLQSSGYYVVIYRVRVKSLFIIIIIIIVCHRDRHLLHIFVWSWWILVLSIKDDTDRWDLSWCETFVINFYLDFIVSCRIV